MRLYFPHIRSHKYFPPNSLSLLLLTQFIIIKYYSDNYCTQYAISFMLVSKTGIFIPPDGIFHEYLMVKLKKMFSIHDTFHNTMAPYMKKLLIYSINIVEIIKLIYFKGYCNMDNELCFRRSIILRNKRLLWDQQNEFILKL